MNDLGRPINTAIAFASTFENELITKCKKYLLDNYDSYYSTMEPHITYAIVPLPEENLANARHAIDEYLNQIHTTLRFNLAGLSFSEKSNLFMIRVSGPEIMKLHTDLIELMEPFRDGCIRQKDVERAEAGFFDEQEINYLKQYGYSRVLDNFKSHISIGSMERNLSEQENVQQELEEILAPVLETQLELDNILVNFHIDSIEQHRMQTIWETSHKIQP